LFGKAVYPTILHNVAFIGKDNLIKAKLEEGYSFRLSSSELGVSYQTMINYVKGSDRHHGKRRTGIGFRKPATTRDSAERHGVSIYAVRYWLREGRIKGRKVGPSVGNH